MIQVASGAADSGIPPGRPSDNPKLVHESVFTIWEVPSWAQPFMNYIANGELSDDEGEARQIRRHAHTYTIINKELYKCSVLGIFQRCIDVDTGYRLLKDIHQGECGH